METNEATITEITLGREGLAAAAQAGHEQGIGRVGFLLVDLGGEPTPAIVDRKDVDYAQPRTRVAEAWTSEVPLIPGTAYRAFFHVYDRTGVNLVAYDRRDFTWA